MGDFFDQSTQQVNPNTPQAQGVQDAVSPFLQQLFGGANPFAGLTSPLQQQAVGQLGAFLNQPAPETRALSQAQPAIQGLLQGRQMQNPWDPNPGQSNDGRTSGAFGGFSAGQQVVNAAQPVFNQNLQTAMTGAANRAPSLRNSAFGDQSSGLAQRALSDFNLFQQQALQQGQQLDLQHALTRQSLGQQFQLGAGQLAQQGQLGGLGALGSLSQAAGNNPFARMLGAGQLGNQITQSTVNPLVQLMLGGMNWSQPQGMDTIVGNSGFENALGGVGAFANLIAAFRGNAQPTAVPGAG
jgi:hypothetical protein